MPMPTIVLHIANESGLHARPAALIAKTAQLYNSRLTIIHGARRGNAKSLLNILALGITTMTDVIIEAEGPDAEKALIALQEVVATDFEDTKFEVTQEKNNKKEDT